MKPYTINRVLVPVDFLPVSQNALQTAVAICKRQLATLTLVHVVENSYVLFPPDEGHPHALAPMLESANENLNTLAKALRLQHDVVVNHIVQSGNPADEICSLALHKSIDLVVMGTQGASGMRKYFIGTTAYRVVKNAPCPVMTIPGTHPWPHFKKILFPVRLVPQALEKYDYIRPIIRKNGSTLQVAGIVKKNDAVGGVTMKTLVDSVLQQTVEDDVHCASELHYTEDVAHEVLTIAQKIKPDLMVITATLDTSLKDFFLGHYTQDVVSHSPFPVLTIRPRPEGETPREEPVLKAS